MPVTCTKCAAVAFRHTETLALLNDAQGRVRQLEEALEQAEKRIAALPFAQQSAAGLDQIRAALVVP